MDGYFTRRHDAKRKRLTGGMQRAGCRTVVFCQQNKGSVWLNFLNWSEPQKENNNYYDMALGALLWLAIPLKIIITMLWIKVILDMWVEFVVGSCRCSKSFPSSTRTNILNSSGNSGKEELPRGMSVGAGRVSLQTTCRIMNVELTCRAGWMDGAHPTVDEGVGDYEIF